MDANGTKFHLLLGRADWERCTDEDGRGLGDPLSPPADRDLPNAVYDERTQSLTLRPRLFLFTAAKNDRKPDLKDRRGAGRDRFGNWYWISADKREVLVESEGTRNISHFWSPGDDAVCARQAESGAFHTPETEQTQAATLRTEFSGLAVTEDHYLVVGALKPAGLLIFDLHAGGPPRQMFWPESIGFAPLDMSPRPGGGVWILDRDPDDSTKPVRYWALDRNFNVERRDQEQATLPEGQAEDFLTLCDDGVTRARRRARRTFPRGVTLDAASPIAALEAISIEAAPDGTALILDRNKGQLFSRIYHYDFARQIGEPIPLTAPGVTVGQTEDFNLIAHDFAFASAPQPQTLEDGDVLLGQLLVADEIGNQAFAFDLKRRSEQLILDLRTEFAPMRLFGGRGLVVAGTRGYYDSMDRWTPLIAQRRPRYEESAVVLTPRPRPDSQPAFDSQVPDCVWHKVTLDACIPPTAGVEVWSRAADDEIDLELAEWRREPNPYLRGDGSEIPYAGSRPTPDSRREGRGVWELGLQRARGRFLQLRLRLSGDGRTTPRIRALRAYYPRFSYLENYLPAVYRDDAESASFLDRFLANLEGLYTAIEDRIAAAQILFDWRSAPPDALDWLGTWLGLVFDPTWQPDRKRLLIKHAMTLFQFRGTIPGLQMALRLALDDCADDAIFTDPFGSERPHGIRIIERFRTRRTPGVALGDATGGEGLIALPPGGRWLPERTAADLHQRYADFLESLYPRVRPLKAAITFSIKSPDRRLAPSRLAADAAAFKPIVTTEDGGLWPDFLERRYATIAALNEAYALKPAEQYSSFDQIAPPTALPPLSRSLADWNDFIAEKTAVWRRFAQSVLGFTPTVVNDEWRLWQRFLAGRYPDVADLSQAWEQRFEQFEDAPLAAGPQPNEVERSDRDEFNALSGFTATATRRRWQDFLARRYGGVKALNDRYGSNWPDFRSVALPDELPENAAMLKDWFQFEAVVGAMRDAAHRFTVLLPFPPSLRVDRDQQRQRAEIAVRAINLEKPAHTVFDVKYYWALFRVGAVRLGVDTVIDLGSRAPELLPPLTLGQSFLSESYLAPGHPENVADRMILGRDAI
jgi:phage tail-like protein